MKAFVILSIFVASALGGQYHENRNMASGYSSFAGSSSTGNFGGRSDDSNLIDIPFTIETRTISGGNTNKQQYQQPMQRQMPMQQQRQMPMQQQRQMPMQQQRQMPMQQPMFQQQQQQRIQLPVQTQKMSMPMQSSNWGGNTRSQGSMNMNFGDSGTTTSNWGGNTNYRNSYPKMQTMPMQQNYAPQQTMQQRTTNYGGSYGQQQQQQSSFSQPMRLPTISESHDTMNSGMGMGYTGQMNQGSSWGGMSSKPMAMSGYSNGNQGSSWGSSGATAGTRDFGGNSNQMSSSFGSNSGSSSGGLIDYPFTIEVRQGKLW